MKTDKSPCGCKMSNKPGAVLQMCPACKEEYDTTKRRWAEEHKQKRKEQETESK